MSVEDIVYQRRPFHLLTLGDHIIVCKPTVQQNGDLGAQTGRCTSSIPTTSKSALATSSCPAGSCSWTSKFKVFRVIELQTPDDEAHTDVDDVLSSETGSDDEDVLDANAQANDDAETDSNDADAETDNFEAQ
ncbi:hypothetical protein BAE44_0024451 [Dichanthelium oligosanthes]|uniref:Uncharacterized protein n=1 Tax=Dichanthelium oligosanthes TaxID=888268 RepID=A0A1E5UNY4_9POAL|nr:hypothetical protein BAE44_0024451 [Dichanthelium oligosanthes]